MFKKITSLILVFLLSCLTPITEFSAAAPLHVEDNDVSSTQDDHDHQTLEEQMALHPETAIIAEKYNIDPEAIYFSSASQERLVAYYGAPDDILSSSTLELLVYFIKDTMFMTDVATPEIFAASPDLAERAKNRKVDFTRHAAFRELISRDDFIDALEIYAASLTQLTYDDDPFDKCKRAIEKILEQSTVEALLSDPTYNAYTHPNIQRIRGTSDAVTTEESQFAGLNANTSESITTESDQLLWEPGYIIPEYEKYIITTKVDSEYAKWICSAPDEILSASTIELLEYFIQTPFMGQEVFTLLSSPVPNSNEKPDYTCHEAFRELISRDDFIDALEIYAAKLLCTSTSNELNFDNRVFEKFEKLLTESSVDALLASPAYSTADHPNLQRMRDTSDAVTMSVSE